MNVLVYVSESTSDRVATEDAIKSLDLDLASWPFRACRVQSLPVLPDGFRQNARENSENARKNAPALNVKFFIAFLDVLEGVQKSIFKFFFGKCKKIKFLCSKILHFS